LFGVTDAGIEALRASRQALETLSRDLDELRKES